MKRAPAAAALAATIALGALGCGGSAGGGRPPAEGVDDAIAELEDALGDRDLVGICDRIFSPEARRRAGGEECARRLGRTTAPLDDPRIELVSVTLGREDATARVRAWSGDEPTALDSVRLVPAGDGYRVDSLSGG